MPGEDDVVKPIKRISSQTILEKLELIEKKLEEIRNKPKQPMDKDSDAYKNTRSVYFNKLNHTVLSFQRRRH